MKFARLLMAAIVLAVVVPTLPLVAQSQNKERITLSPAVSKPKLAAGDVHQDKLTVINDGQIDYTFKVYAAPFSVEGEDYDPNFTEVNERTRAFQWVTFEQDTYQLKAGDRVEVPYVVTVPQNAAPGGHYAVLFAETQPPGTAENVARKKRVGNLLYMSVAGEVQESGSLVGLETSLWQRTSPVSSDLRIKNEGNVHFPADITAHYSTIFGKKRFELNKESLIMPGTTRRIPIVWEENVPYFGIFKTGGTVAYLGKTEALPVKYIILLPLPLLIGIIIAIVLLVVLTIFKKKRRKKNVSSSDEQ